MYMRLIVYTISEGKETVFIGKKKKKKGKNSYIFVFPEHKQRLCMQDEH